MDFHTLCIGCRTYRRFKRKQIPEEILDELLENARIANSAMNGQPLRYVLVKTPEAVRKIQPCFHFAAALPKELGQPKEGEQPAAFIILCTEGPETPWTGIDIGIAVRTMNLNAYIHGVGSCIIGNVEFEKAKEDMELQLRQKQKLESIGTLAGGVAHEINNPINGIINYAELIEDGNGSAQDAVTI